MKQLIVMRNVIIPDDGWIRTIRKAIGMTSAQLAKRCSVSRQRILRIEKDEALKKVTLETLEKVANQLGCRLVYGIVPENDLFDTIEEQAKKKAIEKIENISHSMSLEDQKVILQGLQEQVDILKDELIRNNVKNIWKQ